MFDCAHRFWPGGNSWLRSLICLHQMVEWIHLQELRDLLDKKIVFAHLRFLLLNRIRELVSQVLPFLSSSVKLLMYHFLYR